MHKIQRYCKTTDALEPNEVNIFDCSRPHILSNPFTHITDRKTKAKYVVYSREAAVEAYEKYFDKMYELDGKFKAEFDKIVDSYRNNDETFVGCYCKPNELCHTDIIIKKVMQIIMKETIEKNFPSEN